MDDMKDIHVRIPEEYVFLVEKYRGVKNWNSYLNFLISGDLHQAIRDDFGETEYGHKFSWHILNKVHKELRKAWGEVDLLTRKYRL